MIQIIYGEDGFRWPNYNKERSYDEPAPRDDEYTDDQELMWECYKEAHDM